MLKPITIAAFALIAQLETPAIAKNDLLSDHFDGSKYYNNGEPDNTTFQMLKWMATLEIKQWPEWVDGPVFPPPPERVRNGALRVTYINHATVLIQTNSLNILTDPIWSIRAGPVSWAGPKRVRAPGVTLDNLPPIDVILLSHNHYDHLDLPTLNQLERKFNPLILVGLGLRSLLVAQGHKNVVEMDWWQEYDWPNSETKLVFVPARHGSGRGAFDRNKTLWGGFVIKSPEGNVYFSGDTAYGKYLEELNSRFNGFRLALLPVGDYLPRWFMKTQHMNPDDAVKAHNLLNVKQSVGIHFGTFAGHTEQSITEHETDLQKALQQHQQPKNEFWLLKFGEGRDVSK